MNTAYAGCGNSVSRASSKDLKLGIIIVVKAFRLIFADAQNNLNESANKTFYLMVSLLSKSGWEEESQLLGLPQKFIRPWLGRIDKTPCSGSRKR